MPVIHLVRHGQASYGAADYDVLSETGREQARLVGAEIARRAPRSPVLACGTLSRQRDTALLLAEAAGLPREPLADPRWNEYDHLGLIERYRGEHGGSQGPADAVDPADSRSVQPLLDRALRAWIDDTAGDGWREFSAGATAALRELAAGLGPGRDAVVVTSGGVLAAICGSLLSAAPDGIVALNRVTVNGGLTTVVVGASGTSLLAFNDHAHFSAEHRALRTYR